MEFGMYVTVSRINEEEQCISDIGDKIMENNEAEKRWKVSQNSMIQDLENSVTY